MAKPNFRQLTQPSDTTASYLFIINFFKDCLSNLISEYSNNETNLFSMFNLLDNIINDLEKAGCHYILKKALSELKIKVDNLYPKLLIEKQLITCQPNYIASTGRLLREHGLFKQATKDFRTTEHQVMQQHQHDIKLGLILRNRSAL